MYLQQLCDVETLRQWPPLEWQRNVKAPHRREVYNYKVSYTQCAFRTPSSDLELYGEYGHMQVIYHNLGEAFRRREQQGLEHEDGKKATQCT